MKKTIITLAMCMMFILPGCINSDNATESIFHGDIISDARPISDFTLLTSDNTSYDFKENTEGKVTVIAFLFTNCYDICPVVTYNLRAIHETLNESQLDKIEFLTITVDPWRDNTTILEEWKQSTKSNWTHLTVSDTQQSSSEMSTLAQVWNDFDVGFKIEENTTESNTSGRHHPSSYDYNIAHSTGTVLVDHEGNQRIWWGDYDWIIDLVKEDILNLVAEAENEK
ncbi:MAG: SCO family protein [Candidatus Poseidoniaceae archaeon]